jgi:hypothetical protein
LEPFTTAVAAFSTDCGTEAGPPSTWIWFKVALLAWSQAFVAVGRPPGEVNKIGVLLAARGAATNASVKFVPEVKTT